MSTTVLTDVEAALSLVYRPRLQTQINSVCVPFYLLPIMDGEGKSLNWTCEFTGAADAPAVADGVALDSTNADDEIEVPATLPWATYNKVSSVSKLSQAATRTNFNPASLTGGGADLLISKIFKQTRRLARGFARDFYAGDAGASPAELAGCAQAIDSSGTFAGISPVTYTEWASTEQTTSLAGLTLTYLTDFFTSIYSACGYYPEFCTAPANVFNKIRQLLGVYEVNVVREVRMARGGGPDGEMPRVVTLMAGMRAVEVDQIPIILDEFATTNTLYAFNSQFVEVQQLPEGAEQSLMDMGQEGVTALFRRLAGSGFNLQLPRESVEGMVARGSGLRPFVTLLGTRGLSTEAAVSCFVQTCWKRRGAFGKITFTT